MKQQEEKQHMQIAMVGHGKYMPCTVTEHHEIGWQLLRLQSKRTTARSCPSRNPCKMIARNVSHASTVNPLQLAQHCKRIARRSDTAEGEAARKSMR
jgi:hypothetical protein